MLQENKEENEPKTYIDREKYRKNTFRELQRLAASTKPRPAIMPFSL